MDLKIFFHNPIQLFFLLILLHQPNLGIAYKTDKYKWYTYELETENKAPYIDSYVDHPCKRKCVSGSLPQICQYIFYVESYQTLSKACYNCPYNSTDCDRPHCITGDGSRRSVLVVNRMMPGPAIDVCLGDVVVVDVKNNLLGESTTIHWHGLHQRKSAFMDGVPYISQCPILPGQTFRYKFVAENPGTHFWHSHTGMQRGDGTLGAFIVRQPPHLDTHRNLYNNDKDHHLIILQDWTSVPGNSLFLKHHHSNGDNKPTNILINGKGRIFEKKKVKTDSSKSKSESEFSLLTTSSSTSPTTSISSSTPKTTIPRLTTTTKDAATLTAETSTISATNSFIEVDIESDTETITSEELTSTTITSELESFSNVSNIDVDLHQNDQDKHLKMTEFDSTVQEKKDVLNASNFTVVYAVYQVNRQKRDKGSSSETSLMPLQVYYVTKGQKYRFRLINAEFLNCPMELSIDNHTITVISSDGFDIEPIEVDSFVSYAGERFDFILDSNEKIGNYWIRVKGLMDCDERFTSAHQVAILRYVNAPEEEPEQYPSYDYFREGKQLNALNKGVEDHQTIPIVTATSINIQNDIDDVWLHKEADLKFYVSYDFYAKDNPHFHVTHLYGFDEVTDNKTRLFTPQLNHISMKLPPYPIMSSRHLIDDSTFCNWTSEITKGINCKDEFCECTHVLQVPLNSLVEMVLIDEGFTYDANHPFHLHGNAFRVVGMERLGKQINRSKVQLLDASGKLKRRLFGAPFKDTVTVPDGGYTIIRFIADNPGYWLFHCHIEFHAEIGMSLILKVGTHEEMPPVPNDFPTCSDYMPNIDYQGLASGSIELEMTASLSIFIIINLVLI